MFFADDRLSSVRHAIRGNAERIFPEYLDHVHTALEEFCNHHWPCEVTITVGEYAQRMQHMHVMAFQRNLVSIFHFSPVPLAFPASIR